MKYFKLALIVGALIGSLPALAVGTAGADDERILGRDAAGIPTFVKGELGNLDDSLNRRRGAVEFVHQFALDELGAIGNEQFVAAGVLRDELGQVHVRVNQKIDGLPVIGAQLIVHADAATGEVFAVNGRFVPNSGLAARPALDAVAALEIAAADAGIVGKVLDEPALVYVIGSDDAAYLAWRNLVEYENESGLQMDYLFADAESGALVARHPQIHRAKSWRTYTSNGGTSLPGSLRCTNNQSCGDSVLQNIHDNVSTTYDYYLARFSRDSYNGSGVTTISTGHYSNNYVNAFWNNNQLVFGDGNGSTSGPLGNALDVVAHEFTHAVTSNESNLIYQGESGAMNESLSDVFAAGAEAWDDGSVSSGTWLVGEDTWTPGTSGDALRYMANPTQDGVSRDYYPTRYTGSQDGGGVHWNSGISNLAFYLLSQGGSHPRGVTSTNVSGIGIAKAEQIFYRAQTTYLGPSSGFQSARNATQSAANDLYGSSSAEAQAVHDAWCAVGVPGGSCGGSPPPGGCGAGSTTYTGSISTGQTLVSAGATASGSFSATLTGTAQDIDLYLDRESCNWWSCSFSAVASSLSPTSNESINYSGSSGFYRWRIYGYSGSGTFELCVNPAL